MLTWRSSLLLLLLWGCGGSDSEADPEAQDSVLSDQGLSDAHLDGLVSFDQGIASTDVQSLDLWLDTGVSHRPLINEICARPEEGSDWFELYSPVGASLEGCTAQDDNPEHPPAPLPSVQIPARGFLRIYAVDPDEESAEQPSVPFKLGKADSLKLSCDGILIDSLEWGEEESVRGSSFGHLPDGTGSLQLLEPSPEAPNQAYLGSGPERSLFEADRVSEVHVELTEPDAWEQILAHAIEEEYHPAHLELDGQRVENVAIRTKGFSSLRRIWESRDGDRYSFKVDIDRYVDGQRFMDKKKFVLNNGYQDPSLMREHIAYRSLREFGLPAPESAFVDLWINDEHMGLYTLVEVIDKDFLRAHFADEDGDLYKPERPAGDLRYLGESYDPHYLSAEIKSNEEETDHSAFMSLIHAINREGFLGESLDIEQALRYLAANFVLVNLDSYLGMGHNYYLYEQEGIFQILPWDYNEAFGNFTCQCSIDELLRFYMDEPTCGAPEARPLVPRLLESPERLERYHRLVEEFLDGPFEAEALSAHIDETSALIRPFVEADERLFFTLEKFEEAVAPDGPMVDRYPNLNAFIRERQRWVRIQLTGEGASNPDGAGNCGRGGAGGHHPCGNEICEPIERQNPRLCPRDCNPEPEGGWCGDGICDAYERDLQGCEEDCSP